MSVPNEDSTSYSQLLGDTQAAMGAYLDMIKCNFADISTLAVATNNLIALKDPKDVSDSLKKIDRLLEKGVGGRFELEWKLSVKQKEAVYVNRALLLVHGNRIDQVFYFIGFGLYCLEALVSVWVMQKVYMYFRGSGKGT